MGKRIIAGMMITIAVMSSGCATYKVHNLPTRDVYNLSNRQEKEGVIVAVKFFEPDEIKKIFGTDTLKNGIEPVYIIIDNRSSNTYSFSKARINKTTIPAEVVAERCGFRTAARMTRWGLPAVAIWPLLIPAVVDGVGSSKANKQMAEDYAYKEIRDQRILPDGMLNGCVFIDRMKPGEYFDIRIQAIESDKGLLFSFLR